MFAVRFENVSKVYNIGRQRQFTQLFAAWAGKAVGKSTGRPKHWALNDVSFELQEGDSLGMLGPNGAGKTTILKLLSRVTWLTGGRVLVAGKVPLIDAIKLTRLSSNNTLYQALLDRAEDAVTRGENISSAFADPVLIHPSVCEALRSAERSGQIGPVLLSMADHLDEDNEILVKSAASIIEPLILMILGVLVGGVAISMFLPLFDLTAAGGGAVP